MKNLKTIPVFDSNFEENFGQSFLVALADIDLKSSPGCCQFSGLGSTNGQVLGYDGESLSLDRVKQLYAAVQIRMKELLKGRQYSDPIKIFIKREPHKRQKIEEGRLRLISSVSLIDAVVDRILFTRLQSHQVAQTGNSPVMVGWNPTAGGYRLFMEMLGEGPYLMVDKSAWDWTVFPWVIEGLFNLVINLGVLGPEWWQDLVKMRFDLLFDKPTFSFGDGSEAEQKSPGIMKSGCYLTIYLNSLAQLLVHTIIENRLGEVASTPLCLGDDTIQRLVDSSRLDEYIGEMQKLGFKLKFKVGDEAEFAGFKLSRQYYLPEYEQKHMYILAHLTTDDEVAKATLQSYQLMYAFNSDMLAYIHSICVRRGYLDSIWSEFRLRQLSRN